MHPHASPAEVALRFARLNNPGRDSAPCLALLDDIARTLALRLNALNGEWANAHAPGTADTQNGQTDDIARLHANTKAAAQTGMVDSADHPAITADDFSRYRIDVIIQALQDVIPGQFGFQGDSENYDDIANADLMQVLERKRGLPVALALLYIHAARHCGIDIAGIDFPGHFLLRLQSGGERRLIDPFHGGITLGPAELRELLKAFQGLDAELQPDHYREASDIAIMLRLQNNIKVRALRQGELDMAARVIENSLLIAPDHDGLWHQLGALHARLDHDEQALHAFKEFVKLCKDPVHRNRISAVITELRERLGQIPRAVPDGDATSRSNGPAEPGKSAHAPAPGGRENLSSPIAAANPATAEPSDANPVAKPIAADEKSGAAAPVSNRVTSPEPDLEKSSNSAVNTGKITGKNKSGIATNIASHRHRPTLINAKTAPGSAAILPYRARQTSSSPVDDETIPE